MQVRKMCADDYCRVYDLWENTPGMGLNSVDDTREGIEKYLQRNPNTCFVAEKNNEIIGAVLSGHDGRRGLIYHLAVKISEREQGVGNTLLDSAVEALKKEGIAKVYITIYKNNATGNAFWEKRGFIIPSETSYRAKEIAVMEHISV